MAQLKDEFPAGGVWTLMGDYYANHPPPLYLFRSDGPNQWLLRVEVALCTGVHRSTARTLTAPLFDLIVDPSPILDGFDLGGSELEVISDGRKPGRIFV